MVEAIFIKNNNTKYICNICSEQIDNDKIIGLKCNPSKHIFCYNCILDWYKQVSKKNNTNFHNYTQKNMCPICRKNGGLLPSCKDTKFIKGIHYINKEINKEIKLNICNAKLKNGKGFCKYKSCNIDGNTFCRLHKDLWNVIPSTDIIPSTEIPLLNPNKLSCDCGMKLKNGNGYCKVKGKEIYNGLCGRHYVKKEEPDNNFIVV